MNLVCQRCSLLKYLFLFFVQAGIGRDIKPSRLEDAAYYHTLTDSLHKPYHAKFVKEGLPGTRRAGPIILDITTVNSNCGNSNGSIFAIASGGAAPYTYILSDIYETYAAKQTGNFPFVFAREYTLVVKDSNGETATERILIENDKEPVKLSILSTRPSPCLESSGAVYLQASGGTPPYLYSMDDVNYQSSNAFESLSMGWYRFFVIDANGCKNIYDPRSPILSGCYFPYTITYSQAVCNNEGRISVHAEGQEGPYQYSIDGVTFQDTWEFHNLGVGISIVYVKDKNGKLYTMAFSISQNCSVKLTYISTDATCGENDGSLTVTAENGMQPYTYTIDGINYQGSNTFTGLSPGLYSVTVKDASGTLSSLDARVYDHCPTVSGVLTNPVCLGNDGIVTVEGHKGTQPYQFSIDGGSFQNSNIFENLSEGLHSIAIRDAQGFTSSSEIKVTRCISISAIPTHVVCSENTGEIKITAGGGTAPYYYAINDGGYQFGDTFKNLAPGNYTIRVIDNVNNTGSIDVSIQDAPAPSIIADITPVSCSGNDGEIQLNVSEGIAPFNFSLNGNDFQPDQHFSALSIGDYKAIVTDANGCRIESDISVPLNCLSMEVLSKNAVCSSANGSISIQAKDGIAPYQYSIDGINFQNDSTINNLIPGEYLVTTRASDGQFKQTGVIVEDACISISFIKEDASCGLSNGEFDVSAANGIAPYTYSIGGVDFQGGSKFTGLFSGSYHVVVKDANGLINETDIILEDLPPPQLEAATLPASCLDNDGQLTIFVTGGKRPYLYSPDGTAFYSDSSFRGLASGDYTISMKDDKGCITTQTASVELTENIEIKTGDDIIICEGESVLLPVESNAQLHEWSSKISLNSDVVKQPLATPATTTTYVVNGILGVCSLKDSITIFVNPAPVAKAEKDTVICYGQSTLLTGSGGETYMWSPATFLSNYQSANPSVISPQQSIEYSLKVKDTKGCSSLLPAKVKVTVTPTATVFAGNDTAIIINHPFKLFAQDVNNSVFETFVWSPNYGLSSETSQQPIARLDRDIVYSVRAVTQAGCEATDDISIKVYHGPEIYVPSAFTPNNDGLNDVLKVTLVGIKEFKYFAIYDRWGKRVFYTTNPKNGWNGLVNHVSQHTSTFIWIAEGMDERGSPVRRKGNVTIIK